MKCQSFSLNRCLIGLYRKTAAASVRNMWLSCFRKQPASFGVTERTRQCLSVWIHRFSSDDISLYLRDAGSRGPPRTSASSPSRSFLGLICIDSAALAAAAAYVCTSALSNLLQRSERGTLLCLPVVCQPFFGSRMRNAVLIISH